MVDFFLVSMIDSYFFLGAAVAGIAFAGAFLANL